MVGVVVVVVVVEEKKYGTKKTRTVVNGASLVLVVVVKGVVVMVVRGTVVVVVGAADALVSLSREGALTLTLCGDVGSKRPGAGEKDKKHEEEVKEEAAADVVSVAKKGS